jgi:hypothetical protein
MLSLANVIADLYIKMCGGTRDKPFHTEVALLRVGNTAAKVVDQGVFLTVDAPAEALCNPRSTNPKLMEQRTLNRLSTIREKEIRRLLEPWLDTGNAHDS